MVKRYSEGDKETQCTFLLTKNLRTAKPKYEKNTPRKIKKKTYRHLKDFQRR